MQWDILLQCGRYIKGHMQIMCNICMPVLLVTLLIALSSYEVYIWIQVFLISACEVLGICGIYLAFEGHICYWYIYGNSVVIEMWGLHVE